MRKFQLMRCLLIICWIIGNAPSGWASESNSVYTQRPDDPEAFYFTPEELGFKADGKSDVSDALQEAINSLKREKNFGILFLPEGSYRISKTIQVPSDANAGTFYSAVSNVDFRIDKGNPHAIAIRAHFAQHGLINHCDIHIGAGKAGIKDVGNEQEDVRFFGGDYGIIYRKDVLFVTTTTSVYGVKIKD